MVTLYRGDNLLRNILPTDTADVICPLPDALRCEIEQDTQGLYSLTMEYPRSGRGAGELGLNLFLQAPMIDTPGSPQFFCITDLHETIDGTIAVEADHISYNAEGILARPFSSRPAAGNASWVAGDIWRNMLMDAVREVSREQLGSMVVDGPDLDVLRLNPPDYTEPVSMRQAISDALAGQESICLYPDNTRLLLKRFLHPGDATSSFEVRYGKNMIAFDDRKRRGEFYTHALPYYPLVDESGNKTIYCYPGKLYPIPGVPDEYQNVRRVKPVNLAEIFSGLDYPLDLALFDMVVEDYLPRIAWTGFSDTVSVRAVPEKGGIYSLGMWGDVYYDPAGYVSKQMITSLKYDVLRDCVTEIGTGNVFRGVAGMIADSVKGRG